MKPHAAPALPLVSRDVLRSRRKRSVRARCLPLVRTSADHERVVRLGVLQPTPEHWRPTTRGECANVPRPCPFVSCRHHLYLDVRPRTGNVQLNFPDLEPDELRESCALDVADRGPATLEQIGEYLNITRERARQLEVLIFGKLEGDPVLEALTR